MDAYTKAIEELHEIQNELNEIDLMNDAKSHILEELIGNLEIQYKVAERNEHASKRLPYYIAITIELARTII